MADCFSLCQVCQINRETIQGEFSWDQGHKYSYLLEEKDTLSICQNCQIIIEKYSKGIKICYLTQIGKWSFDESKEAAEEILIDCFREFLSKHRVCDLCSKISDLSEEKFIFYDEISSGYPNEVDYFCERTDEIKVFLYLCDDCVKSVNFTKRSKEGKCPREIYNPFVDDSEAKEKMISTINRIVDRVFNKNIVKIFATLDVILRKDL